MATKQLVLKMGKVKIEQSKWKKFNEGKAGFKGQSTYEAVEGFESCRRVEIVNANL